MKDKRVDEKARVKQIQRLINQKNFFLEITDITGRTNWLTHKIGT